MRGVQMMTLFQSSNSCVAREHVRAALLVDVEVLSTWTDRTMASDVCRAREGVAW